ncbi:ATP-dependent DNA helicase sgs1 [Puccinia graminis f. sp. tritici]|uniref:ATP-dependent DNA helicase sgs1 n=1 Tax=Puccinia graminis f. sp. tritici TaxID=56615 RepID=A0A5B0R8G3_PUCGR|nr:ATP-dependent DNA helicase sgs1 [Puccinia graminis f. sp. tritici]
MKDMTVDNFDEFMTREWPTEEMKNKRKRKRVDKDTFTSVKHIKLFPDQLLVLSELLRDTFDRLFARTYGNQILFGPDDLFRQEHITTIIENLGTFTTVTDLRKLIGGEVIAGQMEILLEAINGYIKGPLAEETKRGIDQARAEEDMRMAILQEEEEARAREEEIDREVARLEFQRIEAQRLLDLEKRLARELAEKAWKEEQAEHMAMLVRQAGEDADRRGVKSIHQGR